MKEATDLIAFLENNNANLISWACPVPFFGDISRAKIATVGINPSNLEFVNDKGLELSGAYRRFHNLHSLSLKSWANATEKDILSILDDCKNYFYNNPYDRWFKKLDYLISGTSYSYYFPSGEACHIDLVPFATKNKWSTLSSLEQTLLLDKSTNILMIMLTHFQIDTLILNGQSVVNQFQKTTNCLLKKTPNSEWNLLRGSGNFVLGYSYEGTLTGLSGNSIKILGYNHNIQSSFGVTKEVQESIRKWITKNIKHY